MPNDWMFAGDEPGDVSGDSPETGAETGFLGATPDELQLMAERPGPMQDMAKELVAIRAERAEKVKAEAARAAAVEALETGQEDWSSPEFLDGLREEVLARRQLASADALRRLEEGYAAEYGEATARQMAEDARADMGAVDAFIGSNDPLFEHPAYIAHRRAQVEAVRSARFAADFHVEPDDAYGWSQRMLAEADEGIAAAVAAARGEK